MLETVKRYIEKSKNATFEEKYVDYIISIQDMSLELELNFIMKHNKLDIMNLDNLINKSFEEAIYND